MQREIINRRITLGEFETNGSRVFLRLSIGYSLGGPTLGGPPAPRGYTLFAVPVKRDEHGSGVWGETKRRVLEVAERYSPKRLQELAAGADVGAAYYDVMREALQANNLRLVQPVAAASEASPTC